MYKRERLSPARRTAHRGSMRQYLGYVESELRPRRRRKRAISRDQPAASRVCQGRVEGVVSGEGHAHLTGPREERPVVHPGDGCIAEVDHGAFDLVGSEDPKLSERHEAVEDLGVKKVWRRGDVAAQELFDRQADIGAEQQLEERRRIDDDHLGRGTGGAGVRPRRSF